MNLMLGAGMVVYGDRANMLDQALNAATFFRNESCGKCVPCRLGSQKLVDLANGLIQFQYDDESVRPIEKLMTDLQRTMELTSICGLGAVAGNPLISVFRHFHEDLVPYLRTPQLQSISDRAGTHGTMGLVSGLPSPVRKGKGPSEQETGADFEILGEPGHE
jgi:NADH:ubiquinone oxidoreductase subunit F (NADH-binding)